MPKATVSQSTERHDLKSLPPQNGEEGGWVELRRMSYDEYLQRREMAVEMASSNPGKKKSAQEDSRMLIQLMQREVAQFEFQRCIVDHNLEDENGNRLDFRNRRAMTQLDPRVGEEIGILIDKMNQFEEDDDEEGFPSQTGFTGM